jgi:colanic acid/amylovoran biosynthesis glycosyltransferase
MIRPLDRKPLKIAVVVYAFPVVSETFVLEHVTGLLDQGHHVEVFCYHKNPDVLQHDAYQRYSLSALTHNLRLSAPGASPKMRGVLLRVLQLARAPVRLLRVLLQRPPGGRKRMLLLASSSLCRKGRFDLCHAHFAGEGDALAWLRAQRLMRCPLIVSLHGYDVTKGGRGNVARYPYLFQHSDAIVVTTGFMAGVVLAMGCPPGKLHQMLIGVAVEQFRFSPRHWQPGEPLRLLTVARLVEKKGVEYAIRAVALLVGAGIFVQYEIVGDGPLRAQLETLATQLGIIDSVHFHGAQTRTAVLEHYANCHLFVFPSCKADDGDQEGQGIVALEAQACGIPIVASRHGGIPEVVEDGHTGLLVPERDADTLAAAIQQLANRHSEWAKFGQEGRRWVEKYFSHQGYIAKTESLYHSILTGP